MRTFRLSSFLFLSLTAWLAACGDDAAPLDGGGRDGGPADASPDSMTARDGGSDARDGATADGSLDGAAPDGAAPDGATPDGGTVRCDGPATAFDPDAPLAADDRFAVPGLPNAPTGIAPLPDGALAVIGPEQSAHGEPIGQVARWHPEQGWSTVGTPPSGNVTAIATDPAGTIYVAVSPMVVPLDSHTGGAGIYRWDGSDWRLIGPATGFINALVVGPNGSLFVGGGFSSIDDESLAALAVWDGSSWSGLGAAPRFTSPFAGMAFVDAIAVGNDAVCIAGRFEQVGEIEAAGAACHSSGAWSARDLPSDRGPSIVNGMRFDASGRLLAYGNIALSESRGGLVRWAGGAWELVGGGVGSKTVDPFGMTVQNPGSVRSVVERSDGSLVVAGAFGLAGPVEDTLEELDSIARWDGTQWTRVVELAALPPNDAPFVDAVVPLGADRLALAGSFAGTDAVVSAHLLVQSAEALYNAPSHPGRSTLGLLGSAEALAASGDSLIVGGRLRGAGTARVEAVARFRSDGSWGSLAGGLPADGRDFGDTGPSQQVVRALATASDGRIFAGGRFRSGGAVEPLDNLAVFTGSAWEAVGGGLVQSGPSPSGAEGGVRALAFSEAAGTLYAGGVLSETGDGAPLSNIAAWDGTSWSSLGAGTDGRVEALLLDEEGLLFVGGDFDRAGSGAARNVARWDGTEWSAVGNLDRPVLELWLDVDGTLWARTASGFSRPGASSTLVRFDGSAWQDADGSISGPGGIPAVRAGAPFGRCLLLGGTFAERPDVPIDAQSHLGLRLAQGAWQLFSAAFDEPPSDLLLRADGLWAVGPVTRAGGGRPSFGIARLFSR